MQAARSIPAAPASRYVINHVDPIDTLAKGAEREV